MSSEIIRKYINILNESFSDNAAKKSKTAKISPVKKLDRDDKAIKNLLKYAKEARWNNVSYELWQIKNEEKKKTFIAQLEQLWQEQIPQLARTANVSRLSDAATMLKIFNIDVATWNNMILPYKDSILNDIRLDIKYNVPMARLRLVTLYHALLIWPEIAKLSSEAKNIDIKNTGKDLRPTWMVTPEMIMKNRNLMVKSPANVETIPTPTDGPPQLKIVK